MIRWMRGVLWVALAWALGGSWAWGQCSDWRAVPGMATSDLVAAHTTWDPDGAGPLPSRLVVGGRFEVAGWPTGVPARNVAMWDGQTWSAMGAGLSGNPGFMGVNALAVYNGELYAGGAFTGSGAQPIVGVARWDGSAWRPLGSGISGLPAGWNVISVQALEVYNGELVVAGGFVMAGGRTVNGIARWNGTDWNPSSMGGVVELDSYISTLGVYNGELYAGGSFARIGGVLVNSIGRWNGSQWRPVGSGIDPVDRVGIWTSAASVRALAVHNGVLHVGGAFSTVGGLAAAGLAAWDGASWSVPIPGVQYTGEVSVRRQIDTMLSRQGRLIVGGIFDRAGGVAANCVASWNGSAWSAMGEGLVTFPSAYGDEGVRALTDWNGRLIAGGIFVNSGELVLEGLAEWDGSRWQRLPGVLRGLNAGTQALTPWAGRMMVGGGFGMLWLPGRLVFNLASWDGLGLVSVGGGPASVQGPIPNVTTMLAVPRSGAPASEDLYVGGDFQSWYREVGATFPANRIVRINSVPGSAWETVGAGFNGPVSALTRFNGSVYAGGSFTASGTTATSRIARWDGTQWRPVTSLPTPGPDGVNGQVRAMVGFGTVQSQRLVVGGDFGSAGGVAANHVAMYTASSFAAQASWGAMGAGFNGPVRALAFYNGSVYAGGDFTMSGSTPVSRIARWNGSAWEPVGGGVSGPVFAMTVSNGTLVVGGLFSNASGVADTENLARWNGTAWSAIGGGVEGSVRALAAFSGELHVGGNFVTVRNGAIGSMGYARFLETGRPWLARPLTNQGDSCPGGDAFLTARVAQGYEGLNLEWRRNGARLTDGPTGTGSFIGGSGTFGLSVQNLGPADAGDYQLLVTSACGDVSTGVVRLEICPPDLNCDGGADFNDFLQFMNLFNAGNLRVDFDGSGSIDFNDLLAYLNLYVPGC